MLAIAEAHDSYSDITTDDRILTLETLELACEARIAGPPDGSGEDDARDSGCRDHADQPRCYPEPSHRHITTEPVEATPSRR